MTTRRATCIGALFGLLAADALSCSVADLSQFSIEYLFSMWAGITSDSDTAMEATILEATEHTPRSNRHFGEEFDLRYSIKPITVFKGLPTTVPRKVNRHVHGYCGFKSLDVGDSAIVFLKGEKLYTFVNKNDIVKIKDHDQTIFEFVRNNMQLFLSQK